MYRFVALLALALAVNGQYADTISKTNPLPVAPVLSRKTVQTPVTYAAPVQQQREVAYEPVEAAVHTRRTIEYRQVAVPRELAQPQVIEVGPNYESVLIHFRTASSPLTVQQSHVPSPQAPVEHSSVQDNAHRLVHEVLKPVIQEVREVIQPYRRITQEIRPVIEEIHTVVHKGERRQEPLPLRLAAPAYGTGATIAAAKGYKAAKAA